MGGGRGLSPTFPGSAEPASRRRSEPPPPGGPRQKKAPAGGPAPRRGSPAGHVQRLGAGAGSTAGQALASLGCSPRRSACRYSIITARPECISTTSPDGPRGPVRRTRLISGWAWFGDQGVQVGVHGCQRHGGPRRNVRHLHRGRRRARHRLLRHRTVLSRRAVHLDQLKVQGGAGGQPHHQPVPGVCDADAGERVHMLVRGTCAAEDVVQHTLGPLNPHPAPPAGSAPRPSPRRPARSPG